MIPRLKPAFGWRELAAAVRLPRADDLERFETAFALTTGHAHAIAFPYGRTALSILLQSQQFEPGEVICPAYTCVVVAHAIIDAGHEPVFVDSADDDFNMDLALVEEAITERTRAILPTSIFGHPVDLDALDAIRRRHSEIMIVQDCCHSFVASWGGRPVPADGAAAVYALNVSKILSSVFGGVIGTDDAALAEAVRQRRDALVKPGGARRALRRLAYLLAVYPAFWGPAYGLVNRLQRAGVIDRFTKYYDEGVIEMPRDYLEAMSRLEARVGTAQLRRYETIVAHRRAAAARYHEALAEVPAVRLPPSVDGLTCSHFVIRVPHAGAVHRHLREHGIELGVLIDYVVPELSAYRAARFVDRGVATRFPPAVLNLPVHSGVSSADQRRIVDGLVAALDAVGATSSA